MKRCFKALLKVSAVAVTGAVALTACGDGDDGDVVLRYSFWGTAERAAMTDDLIAAFEEANPGVRVDADYAEFGAYFDRLATNVAGGDAPDIMTMGGNYHIEYAGRGSLEDLEELDIRTDEIMDGALDHGMIEGSMYAIPSGVNAFSMVVNPAVFEEAGVEIPDDTEWSWNDFEDACTAVAEALEGGRYGAQDPTNHNTLRLVARQNGQELYTEDGGVAVSEETLASWWDFTSGLQEVGCTPPGSVNEELASVSPEQQFVATGDAAMFMTWSNTYSALTGAAEADLQLAIPPGENDLEPGMWAGPSMYYTISAESDHPEEAARFVDFMVNEPAAAEVFLLDRGMPINTSVREEILDELSEAQQVEAEYITRVEERLGEALVQDPVGATSLEDIVTRANSEMMFGSSTPEDAAAMTVQEMESELR